MATVIIGLVLLGFSCLVLYAFFQFIKVFFIIIMKSVIYAGTESVTRGNVHGKRQRKYNPDDYWNDAGDGSGVDYVTMPDGSVRID